MSCGGLSNHQTPLPGCIGAGGVAKLYKRMEDPKSEEKCCWAGLGFPEGAYSLSNLCCRSFTALAFMTHHRFSFGAF